MSAILTRARRVWSAAHESLWFVPSLMNAGAVALAVGMVVLSGFADAEALRRYPRLFGASAESSRHMLATIATSTMTVAGVLFSITVVAVSQASSQYTPRILRNFMRDRASQLALGTMTGIFVYCLVVLRTIRGADEIRFVPSIAVVVAFVIAIIEVGMLVYFVHHMATSLQASGLLARVTADTTATIDRMFPDAEHSSASRASRTSSSGWNAGWANTSSRARHCWQ